MKDEKTTIQDLKDLMQTFVSERDWDQFHSPKNLSMAIAAEAAELMEFFLWQGSNESRSMVKKRQDEIEQEVADIIMTVLAFANTTGIDLATVVRRKIKLTAKKYPVAKVKGRAVKYTEL
jgi:NTP pyrophosphatase (non-canonical NTP hydrolase)